MTLLESAKNNKLTEITRQIAKAEGIPPKKLLKYIALGKIVIPQNKSHKIKKPCGIGYGLRTKVNANIGTSTDASGITEELKKLSIAIKFGADTVMDLSVGPQLREMRRAILKHSPVAVGTVPIYEIAVSAQEESGDLLKFSADDCLETLKAQAKEGVDFFTIHSGVTKKSLTALKNNPRLLDIVSRGGAIIASWMKRHKKENPFFSHFKQVLDIAHEYDITLSLGDGLRPGSILDATDRAQISELKTLGYLAALARRRNVQVIIEGPGHVPLNQIERNVALEKKVCRGAPFYVLGPLVTDIASGYDHISAAIGGAIAAARGADFLCYVTPSEHLRHPSLEDVREGVVASKIAAHAADIAKGAKGALAKDRNMSLARKARDWKKQIQFSLDPDKAKQYRASSMPDETDVCTMCGKFCSIKMMDTCTRV
ncbi:MAG: phosphomethylpyrimidine synthase ThiC [Candidatus Omnitrophota bacterium]|nr:phosphomethylpyrimidine synthase ThiC [Candidatus Omnitrophota bacterium]